MGGTEKKPAVSFSFSRCVPAIEIVSACSASDGSIHVSEAQRNLANHSKLLGVSLKIIIEDNTFFVRVV